MAVDCPDDLARIYRDYWELVYRRCEATLGDPEAALDATQDVFLAALNCFEDIRGDVVRGLMDLARTISYERKRRPLREVPLADPPNGHHRDDDPAEIAERNGVLDALWSGLSPVERRYVADKFAGFSFEEIAHRNRRALGTVSSNLARAREHARRIGEPLLLGSLAALTWRRLSGLGRRARTALQDSSVAAAAQPVGSLTVSLTLAGLIAGAVPAATAAQAVAARPLVPAAVSGAGDVAPGTVRARSLVAQPVQASAVAAAPRGSTGLTGLPRLVPSGSAETETPEDTQIVSATPSPNYRQDHTIVAIGTGGQCNCKVLLMSTDGGANWKSAEAPPNGNQIILSPTFPADPAIYVGYTNGSGAVGDYRSPAFGQKFALLFGAPAGALAFPAGFDRGDDRLIVSNPGGVWAYDVKSATTRPLILDSSGATPSVATPVGSPELGVLVLTSTQAVAAGDTAPSPALTSGETTWSCPPGAPCTRQATVALPAGAALTVSPAFHTDGTLLAYDGYSLVASVDAGRSFDAIGLPPSATMAVSTLLTPSPSGAAIWATVGGASGWRLMTKPSLDAPWREVDGGDPAITGTGGHLLVVDAQRLLFLLAQGGVRCSVNAGVTWEARCPTP